MKKRNRDINIFSMSALDLFASGMGAFILLAVIALPFFPNLYQKPAPPEPLPPMDIVIVLDVTGSMGDELEDLKAEMKEISEILSSLARSAAIRFIPFGDDGFDQPAVSRFGLVNTKDLDQLINNVNQIVINMGSGSGYNRYEGESVLAGLVEAKATNWRANSEIRAVLIITDDQPTNDKQNHLSSVQSEVRSFENQGSNYSVNTLFTEHPNHDTPKKEKHREYYINLMNSGNGKFTDKFANSQYRVGSITGAVLLSIASQ